VETIFSIPGMGYETYAAVAGQDYPVIIAMFTLSALFTMVGYIISDILISIADPRISFTR
jgi:peptide/nickel transport system permease protein